MQLSSKVPGLVAKLYFVDPSLAVAAMGANVDRIMKELDLLGCLLLYFGCQLAVLEHQVQYPRGGREGRHLSGCNR